MSSIEQSQNLDPAPPLRPDDFDLACMQRAAYLATTAVGTVSPNPPVGAVIRLGDRIISEGLFRIDGGPHAEIDALTRLPDHLLASLPEATMYVTLEPCSIFGRTPPCTTRLLAERVGRVIVGALDFTPGVCGEGLRLLRVGGTELRFGLAQGLCFALAQPRNTFAADRRPYVTLKQAVSSDGYVGRRGNPVMITQTMANVLSHRWRAESDAILIGSRTFITDVPSLTTRHVSGASPDVVVLDVGGRLSPKLVARHFARGGTDRRIFYASAKPVAIADSAVEVTSIALPGDDRINALLVALHGQRVGRLLVEGGPATLRLLAKEKCWDEYREWSSETSLSLGEGAAVPAFRPAGFLQQTHRVGLDTLRIYSRVQR